MPAPVRTDTSIAGPNADAPTARHTNVDLHLADLRIVYRREFVDAPRGWQIDLVDDDQAARARGIDVGAILIAQRARSIDHDEHEIRRLRRGARALNAFALDDLLGLADARGVDQRDRDSADVAALREQVARRAGNLGDDGAIGADECVEEARLSNVGAADDRDLTAFANHAALARAGEQCADLRLRRRRAPRPASSGTMK